LVCVYRVEREHRFHVEPVYETANGDAILMDNIERIGDIELTSLLKPLPERIDYGAVEDFDSDYLARRVSVGLVDIEGQRVSVLKGVFLEDLAQRLSSSRWKPRRTSTLVPDGGGFVEVPYHGTDPPIPSSENPTLVIEVWEC
jgi:hypothetical protein